MNIKGTITGHNNLLVQIVVDLELLHLAGTNFFSKLVFSLFKMLLILACTILVKVGQIANFAK